jgi:predicted kinase
MPSLIDDAKHWRERAREARAHARELAHEPELQRVLLDVARSYERMAEDAEARRAGNSHASRNE